MQETVGAGQIRPMVSHLHFVSTRNKGGAGTTDIQGRRSTLESSAAKRFTCGYNLTYHFDSKLNITLPEEIYKTLVQDYSCIRH